MFKVPEAGRVNRLGFPYAPPGSLYGAFVIDSCEPGWQLALIADDGLAPEDTTGWEHVSVRAIRRNQSRIPTWKEMCQVKDVCWGSDDDVMQLHPRKTEYVNCHPHVLHLWRPVDGKLIVPPSRLV